jgi:hypothetical protein
MSRLHLTIALASLICAAQIASAQASQPTNGIVRGSVSDAVKASIPGAELTLSNLEKTYARRVTSNARGEFSIEAPAGVYELRTELPGFETEVSGPIRLSGAETLQTDVTIFVTNAPRNVGSGLTHTLKRDRRVATTGPAPSGFAGKWQVEQPPANEKAVMNIEAEFNVEGDRVSGTVKRGGLGADLEVIHDGKRIRDNRMYFSTTATVDTRTGRTLTPPVVTAWTAELVDDNTIRIGWQLSLVGNILDLLSALPGAAR